MAKENQPLGSITLVYNDDDDKIVVANKESLSKACFFLERLINGPFIESTKQRINIYLEESYSFDCFRNVINYASTGVFIRSKNFAMLFQMIQLAKLWFFDELVDLIEFNLMQNVDQQTITKFYFLSLHLDLTNLAQRCLKVEEEIEINAGNIPRNWARCGLPGHENHIYFNCNPERPKDCFIEDWYQEKQLNGFCFKRPKANNINLAKRPLAAQLIIENRDFANNCNTYQVYYH